MPFIQLFDKVSSTYTYIISKGVGRKAIIIDPVLSNIETYISTFKRLDLRLSMAIDTHTHADHISALNEIRNLTNCTTVLGEQNKVISVGMSVKDDDVIVCDGIEFRAIYTPGHTDDSYSFLWGDCLFTGDILLIGGSGRTDFQNGDSRDAYKSLHERLLTLPDETLVYPAHDYNENSVSTIGYEKRHNKRLQVKSEDEYVEMMANLNLPRPERMDESVPVNLKLGHDVAKYASPGDEVSTQSFVEQLAAGSVLAIDLREPHERKRDGEIPGVMACPYSLLDDELKNPDQLLEWLAQGKRVVLFCTSGERSMMALFRLKQAGYKDIAYLSGGFVGWRKSSGSSSVV